MNPYYIVYLILTGIFLLGFVVGFAAGTYVYYPDRPKKERKKRITERYVERLEKENESLNRYFHNSMKMGSHDD